MGCERSTQCPPGSDTGRVTTGVDARFLRNRWSRPGGLTRPAGGGRSRRPAGAAVESRAAAGRSEGPRSALDAAGRRRGSWPGGRDNGRQRPGAGARPRRRHRRRGRSMTPTAAVPPRLIGTCPVASGAAGVPERLLGRGREASRLPPTLLHARETTGGWEDGGMPDAAPPVDLASLAAGGNHPGTRSRLGRTCRLISSGSIRATPSRRTATTRSRC